MCKKILFFGDSITDAGRNRENDEILGYGYPTFVKGELGFDNPGEYKFYNRGIAGDRVVDLFARVKRDLLNIEPDYISILIGVNDVWHELLTGNGVNAQKFELVYDLLVSEIKTALPNAKIMIMQPFVLEGINTMSNEENPTKWDYFKKEVPIRAEIAEKIAQKYDLPFIELQSLFNDASKKAENSYWLGDGVHPTAVGHELIKREWIKAFKKLR